MSESLSFTPEGFTPKEILEQPEFTLKKLCYADAKLDYEAVMSSVDIIKKVRGGNWPTQELTMEDDLIDLGWHQREFEFKKSFAYTLLNPERAKCLGCVYIYPPDEPWLHPPEGADAVINMWVTQEEYDKGMYPKLFHFVKNWVAQDWPFKNPHYSNLEIPE